MKSLRRFVVSCDPCAGVGDGLMLMCSSEARPQLDLLRHWPPHSTTLQIYSSYVTNRKFTKIVTQYNWIFFLPDERMLFVKFRYMIIIWLFMLILKQGYIEIERYHAETQSRRGLTGSPWNRSSENMKWIKRRIQIQSPGMLFGTPWFCPLLPRWGPEQDPPLCTGRCYLGRS